MTTPVEHGYPDYGRYQARADVILSYDDDITINVLATRGPYFVGGFTHLAFDVTVWAGTLELTFSYYGDETMLIPLSSTVIGFRTSDVCSLAVPIRGPWVKVKIDPVTAPLEFTMSLSTAAGPGYGHHFSPTANVLSQVNGTNVAAGATRTDNLEDIWPGEASFFADFPAAALFTIKLLAVSPSGTLELLSYIDQNTPQGHQTLFLPPTHLQTTSFNGDGVARALFMSLTARPFDPGR